jgi:hypothetical protein
VNGRYADGWNYTWMELYRHGIIYGMEGSRRNYTYTSVGDRRHATLFRGEKTTTKQKNKKHIYNKIKHKQQNKNKNETKNNYCECE